MKFADVFSHILGPSVPLLSPSVCLLCAHELLVTFFIKDDKISYVRDRILLTSTKKGGGGVTKVDKL